MSDSQMILQEKGNVWLALWLPSADHWRISRLQRMEKEAVVDFTSWADGAETPRDKGGWSSKDRVSKMQEMHREKALEICRIQQSTNQGMHLRKLHKAEGKRPRGSAGTVSRARTGLRRVPVSTSQPKKKNPLIHKALGRVLEKNLPQQWEIINHKLNTAVVQSNKS